jgi:hypothetical protein
MPDFEKFSYAYDEFIDEQNKRGIEWKIPAIPLKDFEDKLENFSDLKETLKNLELQISELHIPKIIKILEGCEYNIKYELERSIKDYLVHGIIKKMLEEKYE